MRVAEEQTISPAARLDQLVAEIKALSEEKQDEAVDALEFLLAQLDPSSEITPEQEVEVERRISNSRFLSEDELRAFFQKYGR